jgi:hypothetical protein
MGLRTVKDAFYAHVLGEGWLDGKEYDYTISLAANGPAVTSRVQTKKEKAAIGSSEAGDPVQQDTDGWDAANFYKYQSAGRLPLGSGWSSYVKCRDQALGARDCDVQLVPTDMKKLIGLYDPLLWKPTSDDLKKWLR